MYSLEQILAAIARLRERLPDLLGAERWPDFERRLDGYLAELSAGRQNPTIVKLQLLDLFLSAGATRSALLELIDPSRLAQESIRRSDEPSAEGVAAAEIDEHARPHDSPISQSPNLQSPLSTLPSPPATPTSPARAASGSGRNGWRWSCG